MRVAIAGAGIAGLTAAIALAQRGFAVEVFERASVLEEIGAGIQLSPNAMAVLERLGVAAALGGRTVEPTGIEIRAQRGRTLTRIPLGETARSRYGSPYLLAARADLQAALLARARRIGGISIRLGAEVADVSTHAAGVRFRAGGQACTAEVLIAADGIHSTVRTGFFGYPGPEPTGLTAWRAAVALREAPQLFSRDSTVLWLAPRAHLVHYPVAGGDRLNLVIIARSAPSPKPPVLRFEPPLGALLDHDLIWRCWPILTSDPARPWIKGPVALIGDSAHAMLPTAAQGGAQAIEDAWVIAEALAAEPADPAGQLDAFARQRRPRVSRVVREGRRNVTLYGLSGIPASLRNLAIAALPARFHLARLDWLYGWRPAEFVSRVEHLKP